MARANRTPEQLAKFATDLETAAKNLRVAVAEMDGSVPRLPVTLIHGAAQSNTYIPFIVDWADKALTDTRAQIRSLQEGRKPRVQQNKEDADKLKKKAAKKK